jgi:hypothetical protein
VRWAPYDAEERDDYHLQDNIEARTAARDSIQTTVYARAVDPSSGFDYLDVTRFGHSGRIYPTRGEYLFWRSNGRLMRARSTAGHHPASDWVDDASVEAEQAAERVAETVGRRVYARVL